MCPKAQLFLPPMHVEQAGYFVAWYQMPASFFCHVMRLHTEFADLAFAVLHGKLIIFTSMFGYAFSGQ